MIINLLQFSIITIILYCIIIASVTSEILQIPLSSSSERFQMRMGIGTPMIVKQIVINQEKDISWFYKILYDSSFSKTSTPSYESNEGIIFEDIFSFEQTNITFSNYPYLMANSSLRLNSSFFGGGYTLPYKFTNISNSIIHQLYSSNHINYLSYAFLLSNITSPSIVFGGLPSNYNHSKPYGKCNVIPNQSRWQCSLNKVAFGDNSKPFYNNINTNNAYFQLAEDKIHAPKDFINYLINVIFNDLINEGLCHSFEKEMIYCKRNDVFNGKLIRFTFDEFTYAIDMKKLFEKGVGVYNFMIQLNKYDKKCWILGGLFMNNCDVLFDYEKGIVKLYSDNVKKGYNENGYGVMIVLKCLYGVLFVGMLLDAYLVIINKNKNDYDSRFD